MWKTAQSGLHHRRDFMIAATAVGVSAGLAACTGEGDSHGQTPPLSGPPPGAIGGTVYTGDVIQGKKVISSLGVGDLQTGKHQFYFQGVQAPTGHHWYVSVSVAKGRSQASASP